MRLIEIIQGTVKTEKTESPRTELWGFDLTSLNKEVKSQRDEGEPPKNKRRGAIPGWYTVVSQVDKMLHREEGARLQQALLIQIKEDKDWKTTWGLQWCCQWRPCQEQVRCSGENPDYGVGSRKKGRETGDSKFKQHFIFTYQSIYEYLMSTLVKNSPYQVIFIKTIIFSEGGRAQIQVRKIKRYKLSVMKFSVTGRKCTLGEYSQQLCNIFVR